MTNREPHPSIKYWTADTIAECLDGVGEDLYRRLWNLTCDIEQEGKSVPLGGDGSDGTIEYPPEPDAYIEAKASGWWLRLSAEDREEINKLAEKNVR